MGAFLTWKIVASTRQLVPTTIHTMFSHTSTRSSRQSENRGAAGGGAAVLLSLLLALLLLLLLLATASAASVVAGGCSSADLPPEPASDGTTTTGAASQRTVDPCASASPQPHPAPLVSASDALETRRRPSRPPFTSFTVAPADDASTVRPACQLPPVPPVPPLQPLLL